MRILMIVVLSIAYTLFNGWVPALAQEETILVGEVRVIDTNFEIRSIVNGSREIVSLNAEGPNTVIITGMMPGYSNIIVLGSENERKEFLVAVKADQRDLVHIYTGPDKTIALRCDPRCDTGKVLRQSGETSTEIPK